MDKLITNWPIIQANTPNKNRGCRLNSSLLNISSSKVCLFFIYFLTALSSTAQSVSTSTINISGQSAIIGNFQFEWSVGESTFIETLSNGNLVVTGGVLQTSVANQPLQNTIVTWLPTEIKIYPNPTRDILEINMLHKLKGRNKMELFDQQGKKLMEKQFDYYGNGSIEKWDLRKLAAGQYFLHILLVDPVSGKTIKNGSFNILKIQ